MISLQHNFEGSPFLRVWPSPLGDTPTAEDDAKEASIDNSSHRYSLALQTTKDLMKVLSSKEKKIVTDLFGLEGKQELSQSDLAKKMGISRAAISKRWKSIFAKLCAVAQKNKQTNGSN